MVAAIPRKVSSWPQIKMISRRAQSASSATCANSRNSPPTNAAPSASRGVRSLQDARMVHPEGEEGTRHHIGTERGGEYLGDAPRHIDNTVIVLGHLDSVPGGGWLDGCLGVLAGARGDAAVAKAKRHNR